MLKKPPFLYGVKMQKRRKLATNKPTTKAAKFHPFLKHSPIIENKKQKITTPSSNKVNMKDHNQETTRIPPQH